MAGPSRSRTQAAQAPETPVSDIDGLLDALEGVVRELETGQLPLEDALARFEEGVRLARAGGEALARLEHRVDVLLEDGETRVPLEGQDDTEDAAPAGRP